MAEIPFPTTVWMVLKPYKQWDFHYRSLNWFAGDFSHQQQYIVWGW